MKTNNIFAASACIASLAMATSLTSCSNDEMIVDEPQIRNEIRFNITSNRATRATQYEKSEDIQGFNVSAYLTASNALYFNEVLDKTTGSWEYKTKGIRYWPTNGEALDFYAWVDEGWTDEDGTHKAQFNLPSTDGPKLSVTTAADASKMVDILIADKHNVTDNTTSKTVNLDFSHALAKVDVSLKVENPKIHMEVEEIALVNISTTGDFSFNKDAADIWSNHGASNQEVVAKNIGKEVYYKDNDGDDKSDMTIDGNTFMVIPGKTYDEGEFISGAKSGAFFRIKCKIWNVADAIEKSDTDLQIYGKNGNSADLYIPAAFNWEMGKSYSYTISFGTGNAGLNENGNPSLVLVDWNLDNFAPWVNGSENPYEE